MCGGMDEEMVSAGEVLARILQLLDKVASDRSGLDPRTRLELVTLAHRASDRLSALALTLVGEADRTHAAETTTGTGLSSWLGLRERLSKPESRMMLHRGRTAETYPSAGAAARAGVVSTGQLVSMGRVLDELRPSLTDDQCEQAEAVLIGMAATMDSQRLAHAAEEVLNQVAPAQAGDTCETLLQRQAERAYRRRSLRMYDDGRGAIRFDGSLPTVDGQAFLTLLDATAARTRRALMDHRDPAQPLLTTEQRRADALIQLIHSHPGAPAALRGASAADPGGLGVAWDGELLLGSEARGDLVGTPLDERDRGGATTTAVSAEHQAAQEVAPAERETRLPLIMVTLDYHRLQADAVGAGVTLAGAQLSAGELRRLACDADLLPAVLGAAGEVLDVGRTHRLVTAPIRTALTLRDRGCSFPTCSTPPESCEAHHILPWWQGGSTSVGNMVLLCPHHHAQIEPARHGLRDQWSVRVAEDGMPEFCPPIRLDPYRKPIRQPRVVAPRGDPPDPGGSSAAPGVGSGAGQTTGPPEAA